MATDSQYFQEEDAQENNEEDTQEVFNLEDIKPKINIPLRKLLPQDFIKRLDPNFKSFCRGIRENMREENYEIIGITGYAGSGKSQFASILGTCIDEGYTFSNNINFIPTSKEIETDYLKLPMYSFLHIDEASRSLHKHKWFEKTQQKLSELYDTERENHYLCSALIMPRFNNFTENFRNFFIKYWINIPIRGIAIFYRRDEDKDTKDPWNVMDSIKAKAKNWRGKRVFERSIPDIIRMEQKTKNYWFYCQIPEIPPDIWMVYKYLKKLSRIKSKNNEDMKVENYRDKILREKLARRNIVQGLLKQGFNKEQIAVKLNLALSTVTGAIKEIKAIESLENS